MPNPYPRIRDLPVAERAPFRDWLKGQTQPVIETEPFDDEHQDAYYPWDYDTWKARRPIQD